MGKRGPASVWSMEKIGKAFAEFVEKNERLPAAREMKPQYGTDELTDFLEMVSQRCKFAYWFFGHYHENRIIDQKYILQWEKISELGF